MTIPQTMKAARFYEVNSPLKIEEVPVPEIKDDEVLVRVKAVGLCGSDIHMVFEGDMRPPFYPIIIGHEPSGVVAKTGANVTGWEEGDRVSIYPIIYCGSCSNCVAGHSEICYNQQILGVHRDGALAEYIAVPARNLIKMPDSVPFPIGSVVTDAVSTPFHALIERAKLEEGESIAIYGIGGLGLHAVQIAKIAGAKQIIAVDVLDSQLEKAKTFGADVTINPKFEDPVEAVRKATGGGADVAAEFVGLQETIRQAADSVRMGGRIVVSGIGYDALQLMPSYKFVRKQLTLYGSYGQTKNTIERLLQLVASGRLHLEESITHQFSLEEVNTALKHLHEKIDNPTRILINI